MQGLASPGTLEGDRLVRWAQIEQMVRNQRVLSGRGLRRAQIHPPVKLAGIHIDHRQSEPLGDPQGEGRLAAGCGPEQHDHQRV